MTPQRPIKIFCGPKWAPPLSIGAITARLVQLGPPRKFQQSRNSLAHFRAQNRHFWWFQGSFHGPPATHKNILWAKMGLPLSIGPTTTILAHLGPSWTLGTSSFVFGLKKPKKWVFQGIFGARKGPKNIFFQKWTPPSSSASKTAILGQFSPL